MAMIEHRKNGKHQRPPTTSARQEAEKLFKKSDDSGQSVPAPAPLPPPQPNAFDDRIALHITDGAVFQLTFQIPKTLWEQIGRPPRVDVTGLPAEGYQIRPGQKYKVQNADMSAESKRALRIQATCKSLGLPSQMQPRVILHAKVPKGKDCFIQLDAVPPEWLGFDQAFEDQRKLDEAAAPPETGVVVTDLKQEPDKIAEEQSNSDLGKIALRMSGTTSTSLVFHVPARLLSRLGDPERVYISGTPHAGWTLRESHDLGVTVNYKTGAMVYLTRGLTDQNMPDKRPRKAFTIRMEIDKNDSGPFIKISGPNHEWTRGANMWLKDPPAAPLAHVTNGHMGHHDTNGHGNGGNSGVSPVAKNGQATSLPQVGDVPALQAELAQHLASARETKTKLEQITGMKLVFTKDGNVTVSFMVPGTIAPKDQKAAPAIT